MTPNGGEAELPSETRERPEYASAPTEPSAIAGTNPGKARAGCVGEVSGPEPRSTETTPPEITGLDEEDEPASATLQSGNTTGGRKGTPVSAKEINPADGHTVSPQPADEIEERAPINPFREHGETRIPDVTSSDATSPGRSALGAPNGAPGAEATPAIEMIRGTRRSTEPAAAPENPN